MGELMNEERRTLDEMIGAIRAGREAFPRVPVIRIERVLRSTQAEHAHHHVLGIGPPAVPRKSDFIVPAECDGFATVQKPFPIDVVVDAVHEFRDFRILEIFAGNDRAGHE
jgi:hypothetical protein